MSSYGTIGGYLPNPTEVTGGGGGFPFGGGANYGFDMSGYQMPGGGIDMSGGGASSAIAGLGGINPSIWGDTEAQIRNMFNRQGAPIDTTPQWQAAKAVGYDNLDDMLDAAMERYSAGNMRFGSGHVGAAADTAGQVGNQLAQYYAEKEYQSQTDALNRYLQSMGLGTQLGAAQGDLQLQSLLGQGNLSLGQASQALANDQAAYGQLMDALGLTQSYGQGALDRLYADWNSAQGMPYLEGAQQFSSAGNFRPGQFYQTQGALGTIGSILGGIGGLAGGIGAIPGIVSGFKGMFGGGGGGGGNSMMGSGVNAPTYSPNFSNYNTTQVGGYGAGNPTFRFGGGWS